MIPTAAPTTLPAPEGSTSGVTNVSIWARNASEAYRALVGTGGCGARRSGRKPHQRLPGVSTVPAHLQRVPTPGQKHVEGRVEAARGRAKASTTAGTW
jgi:hypothetical protein